MEPNSEREVLPPRPGMPSNDELIEDAGKVTLDQPQSWGRGIVSDIRQTVGTHWLAEMTNLNQKTIAVTLLVFIAVVAPTLAFGAVYGKVTGNRIGAIETILATSWVGVAYSLIGGMPMCIIGSTGPVLALSTAIYNMADGIGVPYLTMNAWSSIWLMGYCIIAAFFDLTRFVRLATRFTDEIFALLIVAIFVLDAVWDPFSSSGILHYLNSAHKHHEANADDPDYDYMSVGLLSVILGFGTTAVIFAFRAFKFSSFFCNDGVRTSVHDFAVTFSVLIWTLVKELIFPEIETEGLKVPDKFEPSFQCCTASCDNFWPDDCPEIPESYGTRSWFVDLFDLRGKEWVIFATAGTGFMGFLLCYLDNGITWHLINHKHHKLQHGEAYNYDLCLSGVFNCVNGLMGLPWLVATTVPCIIHLNSLADKDSHGHFIRVQETRLTMLFSHALLGASMAALGVLKLLPLPVLYGVFLFMGLSSLPNIQFWNRFLLFFQQPSKWPETCYTKYMEQSRIHKYTVLQMIFFAGVFVVMNTPQISIAFPFMTFLCIPGRLFFLPKFFAGWELTLLDGEDDVQERWINAKQESIRRFQMEEEGTHDVEEGTKESHA